MNERGGRPRSRLTPFLLILCLPVAFMLYDAINRDLDTAVVLIDSLALLALLGVAALLEFGPRS